MPYQLNFIAKETSKALSVLHDVNCSKINHVLFFHFPLKPLLTALSTGPDFQYSSSCLNKNLWAGDTVSFYFFLTGVCGIEGAGT
jgi:hypothetical protein